MYRIFVRNWWRIENGKKVPDPGAEKSYIDEAENQDEARKICKDWNEFNEPGELYRKAEYEQC